MLPPLSVWFREKVCRKAPEGVSLVREVRQPEPWPQLTPRVESKKCSLRSKKRFPRAPRPTDRPRRPTLRTSSGPARVWCYSRDRVIYGLAG